MFLKKIINIDEFISVFLKGDYGQRKKAVREFLQDEDALLFSSKFFNVYGKKAKEISVLLRNQQFSQFYRFETILSQQIHPFLAKNKLCLFTNLRLERQFAIKYQKYAKHYDPKSLDKNEHENLKKMRFLVEAMFKGEDHYMVYYFFNSVFKKQDQKLASLLSSMEMAMISAKSLLKGTEEHDKNILKQKIDNFKKIKKAEIFKERVGWDPVLGPLLAKLVEEENPAEEKQTRAIPADKNDSIQENSDQLSSGLSEESEERTEQNVPDENKDSNNSFRPEEIDNLLQQAKELELEEAASATEAFEFIESAEEQVQPVQLKVVSGDEDSSGERTDKKNEVVEEKTKEKIITKNGDDLDNKRPMLKAVAAKIISSEKNKKILLSRDAGAFIGSIEAGLTKKGYPESYTKEIMNMIVGLSQEDDAIPENKRTELNNVFTEIQNNKADKEELLRKEEQLVKAAAVVDLLADAKQKQEQLDSLKQKEKTLLQKAIAGIKNFEQLSADQKLQFLVKNIGKISFVENQKFLASAVAGEDSFFSDLMHHLIDMSEKLTVSQMRSYIDLLIEQFNADSELLAKYPHLIDRLENFRDSLIDPPPELLREIYQRLDEIGQKNKNSIQKSKDTQYKYLEHCYQEPRFAPVKKQILQIMQNLIDGVDEKIKDLTDKNLESAELSGIVRAVTGLLPSDLLAKVFYAEKNETLEKNLKLYVKDELEKIDLQALLAIQGLPADLTKHFNILKKIDQFENAYKYITQNPSFNPFVKIVLLDKWLRFQSQWFSGDGSAEIKKIENILSYYRNIMERKGEKKKRIEQVQKSEEEKRGRQRKEKNTEESTLSPVTLSVQKIFMVFKDNIINAEPVLRNLLELVPEAERAVVEKQINYYLEEYKLIMAQTLDVISTKQYNPELFERLNHSSIYFKFIWSEQLVNDLKLKKIDELPGLVSKNAELANQFNNLIKIVKTNNKGNALQEIIKKENLFLSELAEGISLAQLKALMKKYQYNSRIKERINLFKELLIIENTEQTKK